MRRRTQSEPHISTTNQQTKIHKTIAVHSLHNSVVAAGRPWWAQQGASK
jgi:hypothetical protein